MRSAAVDPVASHMRAEVSSRISSVLVERGLGRARFTVALFVGEVARLFHGGHAAGLRLEVRLHLPAGGDGLPGRLRLISSAVGSVSVRTSARAERLDAVLRAVGDHHVLAVEHAVVLRRQVGQEFQRAGRAGLDALDLAGRRRRIFMSSLSLRSTCVSPSCRPGAGSGFEVTTPLPDAETIGQHALIVRRVEVHLHVIRGDGGLGRVRDGLQLRVGLRR